MWRIIETWPPSSILFGATIAVFIVAEPRLLPWVIGGFVLGAIGAWLDRYGQK